MDVAERLAHRLADALLVLGVQEREQQADRHGVDLGLAQRVDRLLHAGVVERLDSPSGPIRSRTVKRRSRGTSGAGRRSARS